jgi:hypothetical protein
MRVAWRTVGAVVSCVVADGRAAHDPFDGLRRIGIDEISYQYRATSSRCQRSSVAGVTRKLDQRSRGSSLANVASTARSVEQKRGRATWRSTPS